MVSKRRMVLVCLVFAGAAAAVAVAGGLAIAAGTGKTSAAALSHHRAARLRAPRSGVQVSRKLISHFAVLRRARVADVSNLSADTVADPSVVARLQLNLTDTQLVKTGSGPVWIVPGAAGACVLSGQTEATSAPQPGQNYTNCDTTDSILQDGLVARAHEDGGPTILFGVVPDGNTNVTITSGSAPQHQVPVVNNVVRAMIPTGRVTMGFRNAVLAPTSLTYQDRSGARP